MRILSVGMMMIFLPAAALAADVRWVPRGGLISADSHSTLFGGLSVEVRADRHPAGFRFDFGFGSEGSTSHETDPHGENATAAEAYIGSFFTLRTPGKGGWFGVKGGAAWTRFDSYSDDLGGWGPAVGLRAGYGDVEVDCLYTRIDGESVQVWSLAVGF